MKRIYLSPPDIGPLDRQLLLDAVDSGWVAPLGPHVDEFEREIAAAAAVPYAVALSSGTAALHLSLRQPTPSRTSALFRSSSMRQPGLGPSIRISSMRS